jgi:acid phosphatase family membrane protein YuiD
MVIVMFNDTSIQVASLKALFENRIFISTVISLICAQALKVIVYVIYYRKKKIRELIEILTWRTGGMPSSHAAVVSSLFVSIAFVEGIASNLFIFSFWFALVVLRDAMGVRRSAGLMAKALNDLGKQAAEKTGLNFRLVKEIQGHTPLEVVVGSLLGVSIAIGISLF